MQNDGNDERRALISSEVAKINISNASGSPPPSHMLLSLKDSQAPNQNKLSAQTDNTTDDLNKRNQSSSSQLDSPSKASNSKADEQRVKKKKRVLCTSAIVIGVIALILAIVLPLTLVKDEPPPDEGEGPKVNLYFANATSIKNTGHELSGILNMKPSVGNSKPTLDPNGIPRGKNNEPISEVNFTFSMPGMQICKLEMFDNKNLDRWRIPSSVLPARGGDSNMKLQMVGFNYQQNPFSFGFTDIQNPKRTLISTKNGTLQMMDKYMQIDFILQSQRVYGLGERSGQKFQLEEGAWTLWSRPKQNGLAAPGVHPFALIQTSVLNDYVGIFFRNSNAQSPVLRFRQDGTSLLSYITTGGILEIYFFIHGPPDFIIQKYQEVIGRPTLPPYWSLGFMQGSKRYQNVTQLLGVLMNYNMSDLPMEAIGIDHTILNETYNFELNDTKFQNLSLLNAYLRASQQKIFLNLYSALNFQNLGDKYVTEALISALLIKTNKQDGNLNKTLITKQFSNSNIFLDFMQQKTGDLFYKGVENLIEKIGLDGIVLDMNEPSTICTGECPEQQWKLATNNLGNDRGAKGWFYSYPDQSVENTYFLPFIPGYHSTGNLDQNTLSLNATHFDPNTNKTATEYNMHSLNSLLQAKALRSKTGRFIASKASFASQGSVSSHYSGENERTWDALRDSITNLLNMNLFGMPHTGSNVCGSRGDVNQELCARWVQLSVFYPLARASFEATDSSAELFWLQDQWLTAARNALYQRLQYLRYMYTCLFEATDGAGTCIKPLFFLYPFVETAYKESQNTFFVGNSLKVCPVLESGVQSFNCYFPKGVWASMNNFTQILNVADPAGEYISLSASTLYTNVFLREGQLIPWQDNPDRKSKNTWQLDYQDILHLVMLRDSYGSASGSVMISDLSGNRDYFQIKFGSNSFKFTYNWISNELSEDLQTRYLDKIIILNAESYAFTKDVCYMTHNMSIVPLKFLYFQNSKSFYIFNEEQFKINDITSIHIAVPGELNLCNPLTYQYQVIGEQLNLTNITGSFLQFEIKNKGGYLPNLQVTMKIYENNIFNVKMVYAPGAAQGKRPQFEVPQVTKEFEKNAKLTNETTFWRIMTVTNDPFSFTVKNPGVNQPFYSVGGENKLLMDEYLVINQAVIRSIGIYGLGQRVGDFLLADGRYNLYTRDEPNTFDDGKPPGKNSYGAHPVYFSRATDQHANFYGIFNLNASPQDYFVQTEGGYKQVTMIALGGIIDNYIIFKGNPEPVLLAFHTIIEKPLLPPLWALGWHQCRYGYKTQEQMQTVIDQYQKFNIPLDVIWSDIDYMDNYRDFTVDQQRFPNLANLTAEWKKKDIRYVPIIDAGIARRDQGDYDFYNKLVQDKSTLVRIKSDDEAYSGIVWPSDSVFIDYFSKVGRDLWKQAVKEFVAKYNIDGLWLDMNEAANFCTGICYESQQPDNSIQNKLHFLPGGRDQNAKSISVDAFHVDTMGLTSIKGRIPELDVHNLFGYMETQTTWEYYNETQQRPFILSRSSFTGSGRYTSNWLGDNHSHISNLYYSITGIMHMNQFGIPLTGGDICGFMGDTEPELCARWTVIGCFYPFARNHNAINSKDQEPYMFNFSYEGNLTYTDIMRTAIRNRYRFTRYYYTQMYKLTQEGGAFFKPLFFTYPANTGSYQTNNQFMIGQSLLFSGQFERLNQNYTNFSIPQGHWCNVINASEPCYVHDNFQTILMRTKAYDAYAHIRDSQIIPLQEISNTTMNIQQTKLIPVDFHVNPRVFEKELIAWGDYANDNGLDYVLTNKVNKYFLTFNATRVQDGPLQNMALIFEQKELASHYNFDKCPGAVDMNDFLGSVYLLDHAYYNMTGKYVASAVFRTGPEQMLNTRIDPATNSLVIEKQGTNKVCLTNLDRIKIVRQP